MTGADLKYPQFPARLRLRYPQLKGAPLAAAQVAAALREVDGVISAESSPATGSILLTYSAEHGKDSRFFGNLELIIGQHGLQAGGGTVSRTSVSGIAVEHIAEKLVGALVDKLVERSGFALLAALL